MSRSYKHRKSSVIHFKENNNKEHKRKAVIAVRNAAEVPNGSRFTAHGTYATIGGLRRSIPVMNSVKNGSIHCTPTKTNVDLILLIFIGKNSAHGKKHTAFI